MGVLINPGSWRHGRWYLKIQVRLPKGERSYEVANELPSWCLRFPFFEFQLFHRNNYSLSPFYFSVPNLPKAPRSLALSLAQMFSVPFVFPAHPNTVLTS